MLEDEESTHKMTEKNESECLVKEAGILKKEKRDREGGEATVNGATGRLVKAFQLSKVGDAEKRKLSGWVVSIKRAEFGRR